MDKFILFLILSNISLINSLLEIPLKPIQVKGIPKYGFKLPFQEIISEESDEEFDPNLLIDQGNGYINTNFLYIATVKIGSNKQEMNFLLDTGSSITWVPKKGCVDTIKKAHYYDPDLSSTSRATNMPFQIKYGGGKSCNGIYYTDTFNYINNKDFSLMFGVALKTDFDYVNGADGIIGLARYYSSVPLSFISMLKNGGVTDSEVFSIKFGNNAIPGITGTFFIGKHPDFSNYNTVTSPLVNTDDGRVPNWVCTINSFGIKYSNLLFQSRKSFKFLFDSGTNMIILPLDYYNDIVNNVNSFNCHFILNKQNVYQLSCLNENLLPEFRFEINGNILIVPKNYAFVRVNSVFYSKVVFVESDRYIMGTPFLFAFHTLFDKENEVLQFYPERPEFLQKNGNLR